MAGLTQRILKSLGGKFQDFMKPYALLQIFFRSAGLKVLNGDFERKTLLLIGQRTTKHQTHQLENYM